MTTDDVATGGRRIYVDDSVFRELQKRATPLVDDANAVIRRLLQLDESLVSEAGDFAVDLPPSSVTPARLSGGGKRASSSKKKSEPKTPRAKPGTILPESEYEVPLLEALDELGGQAPSGEVIDLMGEKLGGRLKAADLEPIASGDVRWRNRAQFVRLGLVKLGLMDRNAPRGTWAITDAGRQRLQERSNDG